MYTESNQCFINFHESFIWLFWPKTSINIFCKSESGCLNCLLEWESGKESCSRSKRGEGGVEALLQLLLLQLCHSFATASHRLFSIWPLQPLFTLERQHVKNNSEQCSLSWMAGLSLIRCFRNKQILTFKPSPSFTFIIYLSSYKTMLFIFSLFSNPRHVFEFPLAASPSLSVSGTVGRGSFSSQSTRFSLVFISVYPVAFLHWCSSCSTE